MPYGYNPFGPSFSQFALSDPSQDFTSPSTTLDTAYGGSPWLNNPETIMPVTKSNPSIIDMLAGGSDYGYEHLQEGDRRQGVYDMLNAIGGQLVKAGFSKDWGGFGQNIAGALPAGMEARKQSLGEADTRHKQEDEFRLNQAIKQLGLETNQFQLESLQKDRAKQDEFQFHVNEILDDDSYGYMKSFLNDADVTPQEKMALGKQLDLSFAAVRNNANPQTMMALQNTANAIGIASGNTEKINQSIKDIETELLARYKGKVPEGALTVGTDKGLQDILQGEEAIKASQASRAYTGALTSHLNEQGAMGGFGKYGFSVASDDLDKEQTKFQALMSFVDAPPELLADPQVRMQQKSSDVYFGLERYPPGHVAAGQLTIESQMRLQAILHAPGKFLGQKVQDKMSIYESLLPPTPIGQQR